MRLGSVCLSPDDDCSGDRRRHASGCDTGHTERCSPGGRRKFLHRGIGEGAYLSRRLPRARFAESGFTRPLVAHLSGDYPCAFSRNLRHAVLQQIAHAEEWGHGERQHCKSFDEPPGLLLDEFDGHLASIFSHNHAADRILEISDNNVEAVRHIAQRGRQQRTRLRYVDHHCTTGGDRPSC